MKFHGLVALKTFWFGISSNQKCQVISTLFTGGFDVQKLGGEVLQDLRSILHSAFEDGLGLTGFGNIHLSEKEIILLTLFQI